MKPKFYFFFIALCFFLKSSLAFADPKDGQFVDNKLYIESSAIYINSEGIFLNIEGNYIPIKGICSDEYGIFVIEYDSVRMVECPKCGNLYDADNQSSVCRNGVHGIKCGIQS